MPISKGIFPLSFFCVVICSTVAQSGGYNAYRFLYLSSSAKQTALADICSPFKENDPTAGLVNPSMNDSILHHSLLFTYSNYFSDINYAVASYLYTIRPRFTMRATIQNIGYGRFKETDEIGNILGEIKASDNTFSVSGTYAWKSWIYVGSSLKVLYSDYYYQQSTALAMDVGLWYMHPHRSFYATVLLQNIGIPVKNYTAGRFQPLPFSIHSSFSFQPEQMPFRFSFAYNDWQKFNLTADTLTRAEREKIYGEADSTKVPLADKLLRHLACGVEFLPVKGFVLRAGFNYRRRKEFVFERRKGLIGYSAGLEFRISRFQFSYAIAAYHLGLTQHVFTLAYQFRTFKRKNTK